VTADANDLSYWLHGNVPVVIVLSHADRDEAWWADARNCLSCKNGRIFTTACGIRASTGPPSGTHAYRHRRAREHRPGQGWCPPRHGWATVRSRKRRPLKFCPQIRDL